MKCQVLRIAVLAGTLGVLPSPAHSDNAKVVDQHLIQGADYLKRDLYDPAISEFQKALRLDPNSHEAQYNLGLAYWKQRKVDLALEAFQQALALNPKDSNSLYYLGRLHLLKGDTGEAVKYFQALIGSESRPIADEHYHLGLAYLRLGQATKAIQTLQDAIRFRPQDAGAREALGRAFQLAGRPNEAQREFTTSNEMRTQNLEASRLLQNCRGHLESKQLEKAREAKAKLMALNDVEHLLALGSLFGEAGLLQDAIGPLEKVAQLDPESFEARFNLGYSYLQLDQLDKAEVSFLEAASLQPNSFEAHSLLGVTQGNQGENLPAIRSLRRALELRPDNLKVQSLMALQYIQGSYYEEAIRLLTQAVKLHDSEPMLRLLLVQAHHKNQDSVKALELAEQTEKRFPDLPEAQYQVGFQLASMGRLAEAKAFFQKALELNTDYVEANQAMGDLLLKEAQAQSAAVHFRRALRVNPGYSEAYAGLGKALLALNKPDEVISEMEKAVALDPTDPQLHFNIAQAYRALGQTEKTQQALKTFNQLNRERMRQKDQEVPKQLPSQ